MTTLVGLAFTSPSIAVMVIDRIKFRVHFYQNKPSELHAFLEDQDDRLPIVLVENLQDLRRLSNMEGIHAFLISDDPRTLSELEGIHLLDAQPDSKYGGWKKVMIRPELLNEALAKSSSFSIPDSALDGAASLKEDISFRELYQTIFSSKKLDEETTQNICFYLVGALPKRSWVSRVQKPILAAGISVEKFAELEKFIETSPGAEMVWRAYYDHSENSVPLSAAASQFEADLKDLEFVISKIGAKKGLKYSKDPKEKPLVFRKKRKIRKLKPLAPQGSSMSNSFALPTPPVEGEGVFDLASTLSRIDRDSGSDSFSRFTCARLVGLVADDKFLQAKKQAHAQGAAKKDIVAINRFVKEDTTSKEIGKAFAYYSCTVAASEAEAASKFGVSLSALQTVLKYKPLAFVTEWPEDLLPKSESIS